MAKRRFSRPPRGLWHILAILEDIVGYAYEIGDVNESEIAAHLAVRGPAELQSWRETLRRLIGVAEHLLGLLTEPRAAPEHPSNRFSSEAREIQKAVLRFRSEVAVAEEGAGASGDRDLLAWALHESAHLLVQFMTAPARDLDEAMFLDQWLDEHGPESLGLLSRATALLAHAGHGALGVLDQMLSI